MTHEISLFDGAAWYLVFLFSTTLHEASHAYAALKLGDDTAYQGGQVSLDPTPHIKRAPFGMVVVPLLSYLLGGWMMGWASAPYDPFWAQRFPKRAGIMALAGPAANLALVLICGVLIRIGMVAGVLVAPQSAGFDHVTEAVQGGIPVLFAVLLSVGFSLNLILFLFNLIPFPPLDGSSVPLFFLSEATAEKYQEFIRSPGFTMIGLVIAWRLFDEKLEPLSLVGMALVALAVAVVTWRR